MSAFDAEVGSVWALESNDDIDELARQQGISIKEDSTIFLILEGYDYGRDMNKGRVFRRAYCLLRDEPAPFTEDSFLNMFATRVA